ncbi:MAG: fructose-bisphosphate aldolase class I [Alphaproteobacteria bacterium]|nr:MAG: fructose-bisphosphate aldolase class I [Alphaproteobacteria bacterium]
MSDRLNEIALALVTPGKGILAADESTGTIKKRFDTINSDSTIDSRRDYRHMLFSTPAMKDFISGVILFDETLRQSAPDGTPLVDIIKNQGAIAGIKVDTGAHPMTGHPGELVTDGLDGLSDRLKEYHGLGARFAKWRAVITIGKDLPSKDCISANADALARYARRCQENGLVPIVEPEVLMDGDHTIDRCFDVTEVTLNALYKALAEHQVALEGTILKPNMVISGSNCATQAEIEEVAEKTLQCLKRTVPAAVPGIVFLSGGQSDLDATAHLSVMNQTSGLPWALSYSYGRALQAAPLKVWAGNNANIEAAQRAFAHRARMNGLAALGQWRPELEQEAA